MDKTNICINIMITCGAVLVLWLITEFVINFFADSKPLKRGTIVKIYAIIVLVVIGLLGALLILG